jgi:WD40 repeat protein/serine/threonine protein kinase
MADLQPNIRDVFAEAIERSTPEDRLAYLDEACAGFPDVRARVDELLSAHDEVGSFLAEAADAPTQRPKDADPAETAAYTPPHSRPPNMDAGGPAGSPDTSLPTIPGYDVLEVLGRGGMGVVYKARQIGLNRLVALKMILTGAHAGADNRRRFLIEAEAVARLHHPNIVQIHEIGEHDGQPYFSLEYCAGGSLADKLNGTPLPAVEAAPLVRTLALAIQAAHQAGVIHRDLKPANVLLQIADCRLQNEQSQTKLPAARSAICNLQSAIPMITDFGLAKKVDEAGQTATGAVMGTPSYMAPEQAGGSSKVIGPAADIYALGAILYECLTGRPPFRAANAVETILMVVGSDPVPPTQLAAKVPHDLETICLKCLEKDPARRYRAAADLADDLGRFLKGEPIRARPVGRAERTWRWCRRNPLVAGLLTLITLVVLVGAAAVLYELDRAVTAEGNEREKAGALQVALDEKTDAEEKARKKATDLEQANRELEKAYKALEAALLEVTKQKKAAEDNWMRAEWKLYAGNISLAQAAWDEHDLPLALRHLNSCRTELRGWEHDYLRTLFTGQPTLPAGGPVRSVAYSPDQKWIASASYQHVTGISVPLLKIWDASNGKEIHSLKVGGGVPNQSYTGQTLAFSPDSSLLVSAGEDKTMKMWDVLAGKEVHTFTGHTARVVSVVFSRDGKQILSIGDDRTLRTWDPVTGQGRVLKQLNFELPRGEEVFRAAFSPDGKRFVTCSRSRFRDGEFDREMNVWDTANGEKLLTLKMPSGSDWVRSVAYSPDGKRFVTADHYPTVWDAATGEAIVTFKGHKFWVIGVAFSPDGKQVVSCGHDGMLKLWDAATGKDRLTLKGHLGPINSVAFRADGKQLVSGSEDGTLKLWDAVNGQKVPTFHAGFAISRDGKLTVTHDSQGPPFNGPLRVRDVVSGRAIATLQGHQGLVSDAVFSPDQKWLLSAGGGDLAVKLWDASTGKEIHHFKARGSGLAFSPDNKSIAVTDMMGNDQSRFQLRIWDRESGREVHTMEMHTEMFLPQRRDTAFSPDGKRIVSLGSDKSLKLWDAVTGEEIRTFNRPIPGGLDKAADSWGVNSLAFSPDGKRIVGDLEDALKVWDAVTGEELLTLRGHTGRVTSVAFSPDGKRIVSAGRDATVRVWEAESGQETMTLKGHAPLGIGPVRVHFSPDGRRVFSLFGSLLGGKGELKVWDASAASSAGQ